ncbi:YqkE family protein [Paenibacillus sp. JTLBN-2024]|uniref:DUF3886 domain-containing protein n=1 Tax=Paenibacillus cookii TaxID=157839 RepID=A0ABQ4M2P5_9BACL|nr:YqkE family protein [Paenibacillus cookii]GIO69776.1 hypothetical protein J21TS3_45970 [Paenibacillus cookii]HWO55539.1 YqkE family protein [Paenibacillus cookii]
MAKKRKQDAAVKPQAADKPATLKDLLSSEVLSKLKQQSEELKAEQQKQKEAELKKAEEARKAEQKRRDNDFEYLLENSNMDWKKYK